PSDPDRRELAQRAPREQPDDDREPKAQQDQPHGTSFARPRPPLKTLPPDVEDTGKGQQEQEHGPKNRGQRTRKEKSDEPIPSTRALPRRGCCVPGRCRRRVEEQLNALFRS